MRDQYKDSRVKLAVIVLLVTDFLGHYWYVWVTLVTYLAGPIVLQYKTLPKQKPQQRDYG